jgi:hypothetical protein
MGHAAWIATNVLLLALFVFSVSVQFNDPDPIRWIAIYGAAAVATGLELAGRSIWWVTATIAAVALAWAVTFVPHVVGRVPFRDMFSAWEMKDTGIEESREMYGLLIVAAWMAALTIVNW